MVKFGLQIKADLENVSELKPEGDDFRWFLKLKCIACGDEYNKWQYLSLNETHPIKGSRGKAHLVSKCRLCSRENSIMILPESVKSYKFDNNSEYQTIVTFDCRGIEPFDFDPRAGFSVVALESGTKFNDVNLEEKEWVDYDEKFSQSIGVYNLSSRVVRL